MTASKAKRSPTRRAAKAETPAPFELRFAVTGDKQLTENVIIEVLAAARRLGLEAPDVQVLRKPRLAPKRKSR